MATLRTVQTMVPAPPNVKGVLLNVVPTEKSGPHEGWHLRAFGGSFVLALSRAQSPFQTRYRPFA